MAIHTRRKKLRALGRVAVGCGSLAAVLVVAIRSVAGAVTLARTPARHHAGIRPDGIIWGDRAHAPNGIIWGDHMRGPDGIVWGS